MVGRFAGCCARAPSGHATAAPPSSVTNPRRVMSNKGLALSRADRRPPSCRIAASEARRRAVCRTFNLPVGGSAGPWGGPGIVLNRGGCCWLAAGPMSESGHSLPSHDGLKSCDVRCWSDSYQKIAGPRMQRSVFAAAKQPRHSIKSPTQTDTRPFAESGVTEYWIGAAASVCLDVGRPDHLAPLLGFVGDELPEVGWRSASSGTPPRSREPLPSSWGLRGPR